MNEKERITKEIMDDRLTGPRIITAAILGGLSLLIVILLGFGVACVEYPVEEPVGEYVCEDIESIIPEVLSIAGVEVNKIPGADPWTMEFWGVEVEDHGVLRIYKDGDVNRVTLEWIK